MPEETKEKELRLNSGDVLWISNLGKSLVLDVPTVGGHRRILLSAGDAHRLLLFINHWMAELPRGRDQ